MLFAERPIQSHQVRQLSSSPESGGNTNGREAGVAGGHAVSDAPWVVMIPGTLFQSFCFQISRLIPMKEELKAV